MALAGRQNVKREVLAEQKFKNEMLGQEAKIPYVGSQESYR